MKVLVKYKRKNRESWYLQSTIRGIKAVMQNHRSYGYGVRLSFNLLLMRFILNIDTYGLGGWEKC